MSILTETGIKSLVCLVSPWGMGLFSMVVSVVKFQERDTKLDCFLPFVFLPKGQLILKANFEVFI